MKVKISSMYCEHYKHMNIENRYPILEKEFNLTRDPDTGFTYIDIERIDELAMLEDNIVYKIRLHSPKIYDGCFWLVIEDFI